MFKTYTPSIMNPNETLDLCRGVKMSVENHCTDDEHLSPIIQRIVKGIEHTEDLQGRSRANEHTAALKDLRAERKDLLEAFDSVVEGKIKLHRQEPAAAQAAEELITICNETPIEFKGALSKIHNQVNTRIRRLDLVKPRNLMKTLAIETVFNRIIAIQTQLEILENEKDIAESEKMRGTVDAQITDLKKEVSFVLSYLEPAVSSNPKVFLAPAKEIAETINRVMAAAHARKSRRGNDSDPTVE